MSELVYVCRANIFSDERIYTLASDGIAMVGKDGARSRIALRNVTRVVVYFIGLGEGRSYCRVDSNKNESLVFGSHHFAGLGSFENKHHDFDPFVRALCARVAEQSPNAEFLRGRWLYVGLWSVGFVVMAGLAIGLGLAFFFELAQYDALNTELGAGAVVGVILAYKAVRAVAVNWVKAFPANMPPFDA